MKKEKETVDFDFGFVKEKLIIWKAIFFKVIL